MLFPPFAWSPFWAPTQPVKKNRIALRHFSGPAAYAGKMNPLRVAHLTDLHVGRVTPMHVQKHAVELTNAKSPDLVVITGDFVCHSQLYLDELTHLISSYNAPVIVVLGNHDHWAGSSEVKTALQRGHALVLSNQNTTLTLRGQRIQIVGLDDSYTGHAQIDKAVKGLLPNLPTLGLSHIAEEADRLWLNGIPLVLSGHTHGGQITVARLHEITLGKIGGHRYIHGLYGNRKAIGPTGAVYVGAGIGASCMPFRIGERGRREIAFFELGAAQGAFAEHHDEQRPLNGRNISSKKLQKRIARVTANRERRASRRTTELKLF